MFESLGISADQVYGDVYHSWLRDTHEKNNAESMQMFREMVETGFLERQVILRRQRLGVNVLSSLATALHRSPLVKLDLHGNALRDTGVEVLAHLMRDLPQLAYLDLGANDIGAQGIQSLSFVIAQHRKLSTLILGSARNDPYVNRITPVSATILLEGCLRNRTIRHLDLSGSALGVEMNNLGVEEELELPLRPGSENTGNGGTSGDFTPQETTKLSRSGPRQPLDLLEQLIRTSSTLATLRLKEIDLSPRGALLLVSALRESAALSLVDLSYNHLPPEVGDALGKLLLDRVQLQINCPLRTLLLSGNELFLPTLADPAVVEPSTAAAVLLKKKSSFQKPTQDAKRKSSPPISQGGMSSDHGKNVMISGRTGSKEEEEEELRELNGSGFEDDEEVVEVMRQPSQESSRKLNAYQESSQEEAFATSVVAHPEGPTGSGVYFLSPLLFAALANDRLLTNLSVDRCGIDDGAVYTLCRAIYSNPALQTLSLEDNLISADGAVMLGRALCHHLCLRKLRLASNCIEDEGGCAIASMLSGNKTLEMLDLRRTWLGDRGLIALGHALQANHSVRRIYLGDNHFTEFGGESFSAFLQKNDTVLKCQLGATNVPHKTIIQIENSLKRNALRFANSEPDALKKELIRLQFQKYKLEESRNELENLRDRNNDVKQQGENQELQIKQDQSDFIKRLRELEEQIENYTKQEERYRQQRIKLDSDLEKEKQLFIEDMELGKERLQIEIKVREKVEEEFKAVEAEFADWKNNGEQREINKRKLVTEIREDMKKWEEQRKEYKDRIQILTLEVSELEAQLNKGKGKKGKGKKK